MKLYLRLIISFCFLATVAILMLIMSGVYGYVTRGTMFFFESDLYTSSYYTLEGYYNINIDTADLSRYDHQTVISSNLFSAKITSLDYENGVLTMGLDLIGVYNFLGGTVVTEYPHDKLDSLEANPGFSHLEITSLINGTIHSTGEILSAYSEKSGRHIVISLYNLNDVQDVSLSEITVSLSDFQVNSFTRIQ